MKVLISDNLAPVGAQILMDSGLEVDIKTGLAPEELKSIIPEYEGLVIRSATKVTEELLGAAKNLKVVGRPNHRARVSRSSSPPLRRR